MDLKPEEAMRVISDLRHKSQTIRGFNFNPHPIIDPALFERLVSLFSTYADETYEFPHTASFNPKIAASILSEIRSILRPNQEVDKIKLKQLTLMIESTIDQYAIESGNPDETTEAKKRLRDELFGKKR